MPDERSHPRASVLIVTDDHPPPLGQFFDRLIHQTAAPDEYEVVLVDVSGGADYPAAIARASARKDRRLKLHFEELPGGSRAAGYNRALKAGRGDLIIFFGDDYIAPRTLVEAHLDHHERHPDERAVGIGSAILTGPLRENRFAVWLEESGELYGVPFRDDMTSVPENFFYVGNASVKRRFLERVGPFDERFRHHSWDDYELGVRMRADGMRAGYVPGAKAEHQHDLSLEERCRVMEQAGANARAYETKYPGRHHWQRRLRLPVWAHRLAALQWRSLYSLSRSEGALIRYYRSRLLGSFGRGYRAPAREEARA